jgi:hypothetical protein
MSQSRHVVRVEGVVVEVVGQLEHKGRSCLVHQVIGTPCDLLRIVCVNTWETGERGLHDLGIEERVAPTGHCVYLPQGSEACIGLGRTLEIVIIVQPHEALGWTPVEVNALLGVEDIVERKISLLCRNWLGQADEEADAPDGGGARRMIRHVLDSSRVAQRSPRRGCRA